MVLSVLAFNLTRVRIDNGENCTDSDCCQRDQEGLGVGQRPREVFYASRCQQRKKQPKS